MNYTSIESIHKVINLLFMDELREEFKEAVGLKTLINKKRRLEELQTKMASLKFLDPAAGFCVIIVTTADSNDEDRGISPLLEKRNINLDAI